MIQYGDVRDPAGSWRDPGGGGGMEFGEVHGVLSRVMDGSEHPFGSSYELIELLQSTPDVEPSVELHI